MHIEFSGAAFGVTGSKHLLHVNGKNILLDCGLFQGRRKQSILANLNFPFDAKEIHAVVLSHAHIDHSGALPILVKKGFEGNIYCTHATRDLCSIMLKDSGYIQEKDAEWIRKKLNDPHAEPLYTIEDAERSMGHFRSVAYGQKFSPAPGVEVTFHDAGHILGSAVEEWEIHDADTNQNIRLGFTGDLGRKNLPILEDPEPLKNLDTYITESTYGNRLHDEITQVENHLAEKITQTIKRGGKIIIPSFSVGRTQEVLYILKDLLQKGKIPHIPIFVDSPLAINATEVFSLHPECFDKELRALLEKGQNPFSEDEDITFTKDVEESKSLNHFPGSIVIMSASGMCEAGRIRHHLVNHISNEKNLIMVIGFMAANTLGRKIVEKENPVSIFGEEHELKAEVVIYNAFSAHADQKALVKYASQVGKPQSVFCVHGEGEALSTFKTELQKQKNLTKADIFLPCPGDIFELKENKQFVKSDRYNEISRDLFRDELEESLRV